MMERSEKKVGKVFLIFAGICIVALPFIVLSALSFEEKESETAVVEVQDAEFDQNGETIFINYDQL